MTYKINLTDNCKLALNIVAAIALLYFCKPYIEYMFRLLAEFTVYLSDMQKQAMVDYLTEMANPTPPEPNFFTPYIEYMQPVFDVIFYEPFWRVVGFILTCLLGLGFTSVFLAPFSNDTTERKEKLKKEIYESVKAEIFNETKSKFESKRTSKRKYKKKLNRHR